MTISMGILYFEIVGEIESDLPFYFYNISGIVFFIINIIMILKFAKLSFDFIAILKEASDMNAKLAKITVTLITCFLILGLVRSYLYE